MKDSEKKKIAEHAEKRKIRLEVERLGIERAMEQEAQTIRTIEESISKLRDGAIHRWLVHGVPNKDIAKAFKLTGGRVSQIRTAFYKEIEKDE